MSNDLQTNLSFKIMIDYENLSQFFALLPHRHFFAIHADARVIFTWFQEVKQVHIIYLFPARTSIEANEYFIFKAGKHDKW